MECGAFDKRCEILWLKNIYEIGIKKGKELRGRAALYNTSKKTDMKCSVNFNLTHKAVFQRNIYSQSAKKCPCVMIFLQSTVKIRIFGGTNPLLSSYPIFPLFFLLRFASNVQSKFGFLVAQNLCSSYPIFPLLFLLRFLSNVQSIFEFLVAQILCSSYPIFPLFSLLRLGAKFLPWRSFSKQEWSILTLGGKKLP